MTFQRESVTSLGKADYVATGEWSKKAIKEAKALCDVHIAASAEDRKFTYAPKKWNVRPDATCRTTPLARSTSSSAPSVARS